METSEFPCSLIVIILLIVFFLVPKLIGFIKNIIEKEKREKTLTACLKEGKSQEYPTHPNSLSPSQPPTQSTVSPSQRTTQSTVSPSRPPTQSPVSSSRPTNQSPVSPSRTPAQSTAFPSQPTTQRPVSPSLPPPITTHQSPPPIPSTTQRTLTSQQVQPTVQRPPTPTTPRVVKPIFTSPSVPPQTTRIFTASSSPSLLSGPNIEDLHDALTGEALDLNRKLYQCNKCKVFYHAENFEILKEINHSACVACGSTDIQPASKTSKTTSTSIFNPNAVTLDNYKQYVGQVVTFVGRVVMVHESLNRPGNFAVMFEDRSWVNGFKLVFFRNNLDNFGGECFVYSLAEKMVTVRGLIIKHEKYGYEIVVSDRQMILAVE